MALKVLDGKSQVEPELTVFGNRTRFSRGFLANSHPLLALTALLRVLIYLYTADLFILWAFMTKFIIFMMFKKCAHRDENILIVHRRDVFIASIKLMMN